MMKKFSVGLIFLAAMTAGFSEPVSGKPQPEKERITSIKGEVKDSQTGLAVEFVTVALTDTSGTILGGATTDSTGMYSLRISGGIPEARAGELIFSLVGYEESRLNLSESDKYTLDGGAMELAPVSLNPDLQMLEGAKVSGKRPLIEHKFDRLVLNVSELAVAQTGNALDVLKSSPGVTVDKDGNVKLNGSTVAVWIDGRPSNMSGTDLEAYLQGSDGTSIEKVELITNPSSKYDAEGSGGIINIKTKKAFMKGFSGTLGTRLGIQYDPGTNFRGNISANLMYRTDKTNTFFQYTPSAAGNNYKLDEIKLYGSGNSMRQESEVESHSEWMSHNIRLGNDWNISDKDIFGVILGMNFSATASWYVNPNIVSDYMNAGTAEEALYSEFAGTNNTDSEEPDYSLNLNYTRTFDETDNQELTFNLDYYRDGLSGKRSIRNVYSFLSDAAAAAGAADNGFDDSTRKILDLYSFKADYSQALFNQTGRLEAGLKAAYSETRNRYGKYDYDFLAQASGPLSERNDFTYREQVYAAYVNLAKKFAGKWDAQVGLRGEYTVQSGDWIMTSDETRRSFSDYFDIFPSAFLSYTPSQKAVLSASYSYRISRPKYWQINPFRDYASSTSYTQGNIELKPSYSHNMSLTGVFFSRLSVTGGYNITRNFSDIQTPVMEEDTGVMGLIYSNAGKQYTGYASVSLSELPLTKWWNVTANISWINNRFTAYEDLAEMVYGGPYSNSSNSFNGYVATTFLLPQNFKLGADGWFTTPMTMGYFDIKAFGALNFSLIKTVADGKYTFALYVNDVLNTGDQNMYMENEGVRTYVLNQSFTQSVMFGFTWRFGNNNSQQRQRNVGNLDESSRF